MENKYLKIVSKKDFNIDELIQAYFLKHHHNKTYTSYMLSVYVDDLENWGWLRLQENKINQDGR